MKKIIVVGIIMWLALALSLGVFAFQDEPDGFRDLKWGDPPSEEIIWNRTDEYGMNLYTLPKEKANLNLGDTELLGISYFFYGEHKRFGGVRLFFEDELDYSDLKITCRARFGNESEESSYPPYCLWTGLLATVTLEYDRPFKLGYLTLRSTSIFAEHVEVKRKKEVEKAEGDW